MNNKSNNNKDRINSPLKLNYIQLQFPWLLFKGNVKLNRKKPSFIKLPIWISEVIKAPLKEEWRKDTSKCSNGSRRDKIRINLISISQIAEERPSLKFRNNYKRSLNKWVLDLIINWVSRLLRSKKSWILKIRWNSDLQCL